MNPRRIFTPGFLVAAGVLLISVIGLQSVLASIGAVLVKKPVPLRQQLWMVDRHIGPYERIHDGEELPREVVAELGTEKYINFVYRDTRKEENEPGSIVTLHVAYYTGTPDAVPHVPERCVAAGGAKAAGYEHYEIELDSPFIQVDDGRVTGINAEGESVDLPDREVPLRVVRFMNTRNAAGGGFNVAYFFVANNAYTAWPEQVRLLAFKLREKYAYWCKVEVRPLGVSDPKAAAEVAGEFLACAMPEIMTCLPDWQAVKAGNWPPSE